MAETQVSSVKTIGRAATVLRALSGGPPGGLRLSDVVERADLGKATVHRLLQALSDVGFVEFDDSDKVYRLGYALFALGAEAQAYNIVALARPSLQRLAAATGDTVYLSVRDGDEVVCVDRRTGPFPIRTLTLDVGDRRPLGVGAGALAMLAFESDEEIERILRANRAARLAFPAFDDATVRAQIAEARKLGFTLNDGAIVSAMTGIGVPVRDAAGRVVAALSLAAIRERFEGEQLSDRVALLRAESDELSRTLAARPAAPARQRRSRVKEEQV
ncbi:MAG: IclR family transcriptional regulator [Microvirga sp.]|nr:IclR family transcriptional regulator [Microvirga sp.]